MGAGCMRTGSFLAFRAATRTRGRIELDQGEGDDDVALVSSTWVAADDEGDGGRPLFQPWMAAVTGRRGDSTRQQAEVAIRPHLTAAVGEIAHR